MIVFCSRALPDGVRHDLALDNPYARVARSNASSHPRLPGSDVGFAIAGNLNAIALPQQLRYVRSGSRTNHAPSYSTSEMVGNPANRARPCRPCSSATKQAPTGTAAA